MLQPAPDPTDRSLLGALRAILRGACYQADVLSSLLDLPDLALTRLSPGARASLAERAGGSDQLSVLTRLFFLGEPVAWTDLERACAPLSPDSWVAAGLLRLDGNHAAARVQMIPFDRFVLAVDAPWERDGGDDVVMPLTPSTVALGQCLIDSRAGDTLDLGTGNGVLALHAAGWSGRVVATDATERAIRFAAFNAALNEVPHVEFLRGDWFEPVEGRTFDRVACNPPFAIGPRRELLYRDSGAEGDGLSARLVREAARFLRPGGSAQVLVNWTHSRSDDGAGRVRSWVAGTGCDAWVLCFQTVAPERYVEWWLPPDGQRPADEYQARFREWLQHLEALGAGRISYGLVTLRRRPGEANWFDLEPSPPRVGSCGRAIAAGFAHRDLLAAGPHLLPACRLRVAEAVRVTTQASYEQGEWGGTATRMEHTRGLLYSVPVDPDLAESLQKHGGERPVRALLAEMAPGARAAASRARLLGEIRELVLRGILEPVPGSEPPDSAGFHAPIEVG